ncbi:MAG: hypothetical protein LBU15_00185, partial [Rickettsiales bacterium]|nr:hypothetical protein [Rickettsiales bacterium]
EAEETKTLEGGKMEIIYEDDSIYVGRVGVDGKPHGRGTWVDAEKKELRQGEFARGNFVGGEVVMELSDNISYAGGYRNGKFDGMGELKSKDGEYYKKGRFGDNILIDGSLNIISLDGSIHKADIKDDGSLSGTNVEIFHLNGNYESGEFLRGSLYNGKIRTTYPNGSSYDGEYSNGLRSGYGIVTYKNGDIAEGESLNGKPLGMFTKSKGSNIYRHEAYDNEGRLASHEMLSKTPVRLGGEENRFEMNAKREPIWKEIYSYDSGIMKDSIILYPPSKDGIPEKTIEIDFNLANALLSSGEATDLEGLVAKGVLVAKDREGQRNLSGVSSSEIRGLLTDAAKKMAEIRASKGADGFSGGFPLEAQAMMLSMVGNRNLKNLRFCTKKTSHTTSMTSFLESIGMNRQNLKDSKEDHIIIHMVTDTGDHAVCFLVNLKRLREVGWDKLDASNEIFINFFDSSRAVGNENYKGSFGGIRKNCRPLGQAQQEKGNCWLQAIAAELMALENPEVVGRVLSRENPTYEPNERVFLGAGDIPNEFALKQLLKLQEVVDTLAVKLDGDIPLVESIIVGHLKDRIAELAEGEKLLAELDNRIEEAFEIFGEKLKKLEGGVSELEDEEYRKRKEEITKKYKDKLSKVINDISGDSKKTPSTEGAEDEKSKEKAKELPKLIKNLKTFVVAGEEINKQADELASRLELTLEKFREAREKANGLAEEELKLANLLESTANLLEEKTELSPTLPSPLLQS